MQVNALNLPDGLSIRPSRDGDKLFVETLFKSTRDDLRMIDAEDDFIETLIEQQHYAQTVGYGEQFPNAMYFVIEKQNERIGRIVVDFGPNEIRIVDVAFIPQTHNRGYGTAVIRALKLAAGSAGAPLVLTVSRVNPAARQLYHREGFRVEQCNEMAELMVWYPGSGPR